MWNAGDQPGWLKLAWQYLRRPRLDPTSMIGDNKSVMAFNLIWMFDKVSNNSIMTFNHTSMFGKVYSKSVMALNLDV